MIDILRCKTKLDRRMHVTRLDKLFDKWASMTDAELMAEVQQRLCTFVTEGTRDEFLKCLVMLHVELMC